LERVTSRTAVVPNTSNVSLVIAPVVTKHRLS
jgi:hypothetical protein